VAQGAMPEPDYLFVAAGTVGTFGGLHLGCRLAGLKTRVIGIRILTYRAYNSEGAAAKLNEACRYLHGIDPDCPRLTISPAELALPEDYAGPMYAQFTREGMEAIKQMYATEKIRLDGTYTGKALAGTLDYIKKNRLQDRVILFWNTLNAADLSHLIKDIDYHKLKPCFHPYFELPDQEFETSL